MPQIFSRSSVGAVALTAFLFLFAASPALATLIGQSITVDLISPNDGNLSLSDTVIAVGGNEILPADGSAIGTVLLSTEFISLGLGGTGDQIVIGLEEGVAGGQTGYGADARYVFSGLYDSPVLAIDTISVTLTNITGATVEFSHHTLTVYIDDLVIGDIPGIDSGSIAVEFTTMVPEPGTATLLLLGLSGLALRRRASR